VVPQ
jgi:hypothetical protein